MKIIIFLQLLVVNTCCSLAFNVNTTLDQIDINPGDGICSTQNHKCSLRAAIIESNSTGEPNIIILPIGIYQINIIGRNENSSLTGDFDILNDIQILGESLENTIIDANFNDRIFDLIPDSQTTVLLSNLTIINGEAIPPNSIKGLPDEWSGGAIKVNELSHLQLDTVLFNNHHASNGGIIYTKGKVVGSKVQLINSSVQFGGGAVYIKGEMAQLIFSKCLFEGNQSQSVGAAIASFPFVTQASSRLSLELNQCAFINNTNLSSGGIIFNIRISQSIIRNSTFSGNTADVVLFNDEFSTFHILNSTIVHNNARFLLDAHFSPLFVSISNSVIADNHTTPSCQSLFTSRGGNYFSNFENIKFCKDIFHSTDIISDANPLLSPLIKYQQSWQQIHLPLYGSTLIDNGLDSICEAQDQLGLQRQQDSNFDGFSHCNIGATAIGDVLFVNSF